ncbi:MAG: GDSL-type esterase/lipase family protein [Actinomycetes bacterium]
MHTVLCYGDSNTWGAIPGSESGRFAPDVRWPGITRARLGADFEVIENGLNGRTTTFDYLPRLWRNGKDLLVPVMEISHPLDLVVILLGTNDVSLPYLDVSDIVRGTGELVSIVRGCDDFGPAGTSPPKVLVVGPHIVGPLSVELRALHEGAEARSRALTDALGGYLATIACDFLDLSEVVQPSAVDPWHWEADGHRAAGEAIAAKVRLILT